MQFDNARQIDCFRDQSQGYPWSCSIAYGPVEDMDISIDNDVDFLDIELNAIVWKEISPIDKLLVTENINIPVDKQEIIKTGKQLFRYEAHSISFGLVDDTECSINENTKTLKCRMVRTQ